MFWDDPDAKVWPPFGERSVTTVIGLTITLSTHAASMPAFVLPFFT